MDNKEIDDELRNVGELLKSIRESLFETARQSVSGNGEGNWQKAESLFRLAKEADLLGTKILGLTEGQSSNQSVKAESFKTKNTVATPSRKRRKLKKGEYPKFMVRGDSLFKIGLKRDGTNEYSHSVPYSVFQSVVGRLLDVSTSQSEFVADDILSDVDAPDYQVYIVLAVLRENEILEVPRRGYHKFVSTDEFEQAANMLWEKLRQA